MKLLRHSQHYLELISTEFFSAHGEELSSEDSERARTITPRMLLSHSSGLGIDLKAHLDFEPGTEYAYSGAGLMYLQQAIEQQTGKSLDVLASEEVFEPLGMTNSRFLAPERPRFMASTESSRAKSKEPPKTPNAAHSLHTTASDYSRLMIAWMEDPSPIMQEAFRPQINLSEDNQRLPGETEPAAKEVSEDDKMHLAWGLGLGLELDDEGNAVKVFHTGDMNQYRAQVAMDLRAGSCIVFFANGRDHRESNGHILGPMVITPKIPIPHAYAWFYGKFPFARTVDELIGGPNSGLRAPEPKPEGGSSYAGILAEMPPGSTEEEDNEAAADKDATEKKENESSIEEKEAGNEDNLPSTPTPLPRTPKPPGKY